MNIDFFVEAGSEFGYGHLIRCVAIAQAFSEKASVSRFLVRGDAPSQSFPVGFAYNKVEWLEQKIYELGDVACLDSYHASLEFCKSLVSNYKQVLFLDDFARLSYPGGIVVNGAVSAERVLYPQQSRATYLLGPSFQALRQPFWDVPHYEVHNSVGCILITFGGSDPKGWTPRALTETVKTYPNAQKHVVIGSGCSNEHNIAHYADEQTTIYKNLDGEYMLSLMLKADIAISAAGQTLSELARVGVPTFGIKVADNQEANVSGWKRCNFLLPDDLYPGPVGLSLRILSSEAGRRAIDGQGARRIVEAIL